MSSDIAVGEMPRAGHDIVATITEKITDKLVEAAFEAIDEIKARIVEKVVEKVTDIVEEVANKAFDAMLLFARYCFAKLTSARGGVQHWGRDLQSQWEFRSTQHLQDHWVIHRCIDKLAEIPYLQLKQNSLPIIIVQIQTSLSRDTPFLIFNFPHPNIYRE